MAQRLESGPRQTQNRKKTYKPYKPLKLIRFFTIFCGFVAQRLESGPRQTQNRKKPYKRYKPKKILSRFIRFLRFFAVWGIAGLGEAVTQYMVYTVFYGFLRFFAVLRLRGWNPDPGRAQNRLKPYKRYKPQKNLHGLYRLYGFLLFWDRLLGKAVTHYTVYTVFCGFLLFCGSEAGIRMQADPEPQKTV